MQARSVVLLAAAVVLTFGAITLTALEGREVVVVETRARDGTARRTRTWIADEDGAAWLEAANPERPFLVALRANPSVELERGGRRQRCHATEAPNPAGHRRIRRLLAARYGWADRWIGWLTDTSGSSAVRLDCE
jgi:hypothetical protein